MHQEQLQNFFVTGISYRKSDACIRGDFAVNEVQYEEIFRAAAQFPVSEFFILSTCNRTEIYGIAGGVNDLVELLCSATKGDSEEFVKKAYVKSGISAVNHLFDVCAGLDSQILGDYEIVGQLKQAVKFSKGFNGIGSFLERLVNDALQAAKKIRTSTALSSGIVSVSFAAVQVIRNNAGFNNRNILLIGTGKFGSNTCKNLVDYLPGSNITLINRTGKKAESLANKFGVTFKPWDCLESSIQESNVILVATHAPSPVLLKEHFKSGDPKLVIDLSIPCNVSSQVGEVDGIRLIGVDELSKIKDETLQMRLAEVPKARSIIAGHVEAFLGWYEMRRHVPVLKAVKNKLIALQSNNIFDPEICISVSRVTGRDSEQRIQKIISGMAVKMKTENQRGCHYIEAINDFISPTTA